MVIFPASYSEVDSRPRENSLTGSSKSKVEDDNKVGGQRDRPVVLSAVLQTQTWPGEAAKSQVTFEDWEGEQKKNEKLNTKQKPIFSLTWESGVDKSNQHFISLFIVIFIFV